MSDDQLTEVWIFLEPRPETTSEEESGMGALRRQACNSCPALSHKEGADQSRSFLAVRLQGFQRQCGLL